MEVVGGRGRGGHLGPDLLDGGRLERPDGRQVDAQPPAQRDGAGATVRELFVVEERVGAGGDDLVREHRRFGRVAAMDGDVAGFDAREEGPQAVDVERFVERVGDRLADQQVIGDLDRSGDVLLAGRGLREHRRHEVIGFHALDRRRVAPSTAEPKDHERAVEVPPPTRLEHRRVEDRLPEGLVDGAAAHVPGDLVEREAVVRSEGQDDGVVVRGGLQLEVERSAELFAQREAERPVDTPAVGRVDDQLHPAGLVEEPLEHQVVLGRGGTECGAADRDVVDDHRGGFGSDAGGLGEPASGAVGVPGVQEGVDPAAQVGDLDGELGGPRRCLAHPERDGRRHPRGVAHAHDTGFDPADLPRVRTEEEDVARHRLHRPVLVDGADEGVIGFGDDAVVPDLGNCATRGQRGQPGAFPAAELTVHRVVVDVGAPPTPAGLDAVGDEVDDLVELWAREVDERCRPTDQLVQIIGPPFLGRGFGDHVLRGDVERQSRHLDAVESAGAHRDEEGGALDELVAGERIEAPLWCPGSAVVRPADSLQEGRDAAGGADLAHQLDGSDVDPELERGRGDQGFEVAGAEAGLDSVSSVLREAAVVRGDDVVAEAFGEEVGEAFGEPSGVDEDERRAVLLDEVRDAVEDVGHLLRGGDGFELAVGKLEREVEVALMAGVDDGRQGPVADEEGGDALDRPLGRGEPDPARSPVADRFEALERHREVSAALVAGDGVDLVDDDGLDGLEPLAALGARDEEVQRFGGGDDEVRWLAQHRGALRAGGVTGADRHPQIGRCVAQLGGDVGDLGQGTVEVLGDVDREGLERGHVDHLSGALDGVAGVVAPVQPVDADEEPGERLS